MKEKTVCFEGLGLLIILIALIGCLSPISDQSLNSVPVKTNITNLTISAEEQKQSIIEESNLTQKDNLTVNIPAKIDVSNQIVIKKGDLLEVPFYEAERAYWCGPAVIQSVLEYYNITKNQTEIAKELGFLNEELIRLGIFKKSTMISQMYNYFERHGFDVVTYKEQSDQWSLETMEKYLKQGKPVIVLQRSYLFSSQGDYRIVIGKKEGYYFVIDTGSGKTLYSTSKFLKLWQANPETKYSNTMIIPIPQEKGGN